MMPRRAREVGHNLHDVGSTSPSFPSFDLYLSLHKSPHISSSFAECEIKSRPLDLTNEIDGYEYVTCIDRDLVD